MRPRGDAARRSVLAAAALLYAGRAWAACRLERRAEVPVRVIEGFPIVPASINYVPVSLLLDTGAQGNLIVPAAAETLRLPLRPGAGTRIIGTGGSREVPVVMVSGLRLGGSLVPDMPAPVAPLPLVPQVTPEMAGLLGAPLLAAYDLELDVQKGRMALFDPFGCGPDEVPFAGRVTTVPLEVTREGEAFLPVQVNGTTLLALLDTGSRATLLTVGAARRLGLGAAVSANTARGVDGERLPLEHVRAREMRVGADIRTDVPISIAPLQLGRGDMLLGLDYLGLRRVWVSYAAGRVVIALP